MKRSYLGEFEELVLLVVAVQDGRAYGVQVAAEILAGTGRDPRLNQVHSALQRLEEKGMVRSKLGEATAERGGRSKRLYTITAFGQRRLHEIQEVRTSFWSRLTMPFNLSFGG